MPAICFGFRSLLPEVLHARGPWMRWSRRLTSSTGLKYLYCGGFVSIIMASSPRVLIYGGKGALGTACVSYFKARNWVSGARWRFRSYCHFVWHAYYSTGHGVHYREDKKYIRSDCSTVFFAASPFAINTKQCEKSRFCESTNITSSFQNWTKNGWFCVFVPHGYAPHPTPRMHKF